MHRFILDGVFQHVLLVNYNSVITKLKHVRKAALIIILLLIQSAQEDIVSLYALIMFLEELLLFTIEIITPKLVLLVLDVVKIISEIILLPIV
jgi:hypothetical protein